MITARRRDQLRTVQCKSVTRVIERVKRNGFVYVVLYELRSGKGLREIRTSTVNRTNQMMNSGKVDSADTMTCEVRNVYIHPNTIIGLSSTLGISKTGHEQLLFYLKLFSYPVRE